MVADKFKTTTDSNTSPAILSLFLALPLNFLLAGFKIFANNDFCVEYYKDIARINS